MSLVEQINAHNPRYAAGFDKSRLAMPPAKRWAILTCMDARITPNEIVGFQTGDAHVIRNAGALVTEDAVRSFVISAHLLGTREFAIIGHTGCGMLTFEEEPIRRQIAASTGADTSSLSLLPFSDLEASIREQVRRLASSPFVPAGIPITGFAYEVETGMLREVANARSGLVAV